jgi:hypothetical protein
VPDIWIRSGHLKKSVTLIMSNNKLITMPPATSVANCSYKNMAYMHGLMSAFVNSMIALAPARVSAFVGKRPRR